jgi:hypothetical protein
MIASSELVRIEEEAVVAYFDLRTRDSPGRTEEKYETPRSYVAVLILTN